MNMDIKRVRGVKMTTDSKAKPIYLAVLYGTPSQSIDSFATNRCIFET
jgi:hypothetical protein